MGSQLPKFILMVTGTLITLLLVGLLMRSCDTRNQTYDSVNDTIQQMDMVNKTFNTDNNY